jgi:phosphatidylserine/phosphatidylglycerophosphate/cardiolipin synthase-like enzyme
MKFARSLIVVFMGLAAVAGMMRLLHPAQSALAIRTAAPLDVVINEVAWAGTAVSTTADEWIELKNNTVVTVDLSGWTLRAVDGTPNVALTGAIAPQGYYLLERTDDNTISDIPADQLYTGDLGNGGDSLQLTDPLSNVIDTANGDGGAWPAGSTSPDYYSMERIDSLAPDSNLNWASNDGITRNGLDANNDPVNGTPKQPNSAKPYVPTPPGSVLISAVHFNAYNNGDEGFRLTNVSTQTITLTNWIATDGEATLNLTGTLAPGQAIWLAKRAITFTQQFGFKPDYEYDADTDPAVPNLTGGVPLLSDDDELLIRESANNWIDAVVWGDGHITSTAWITGWIGLNVQRYSNAGIPASGQIIYRKLDEATGLVSDTDTALDWANDRTDPVAGRKVLFPGWDLERFWQTARVTATAHLTVAISPDNAYRVISDDLGSARQSIKMEMYTFDNFMLADVVTRALGRGVSVTILLEGGPVGGLEDDERWICQQIEIRGGQCWFMITDTSGGNKIHARYDYLHAKMIIVDDRAVAIGSENLSPRTLTYDDPSDGTNGHRGLYVLTDASGVVSRTLDIWNADFDPVHHRDLYRWNISDTLYGPPQQIGFVPFYTLTLSGYKIRYPAPLALTAPLTFELLTAPESALRASDSLLGLINRSGAGDTIDVEQLDEPPYWGPSSSNPIDDPNIRLQALIAAASRGAQVRLLLDRYFDDGLLPTSNAATQTYVDSLRALSPTLMSNLEVRLGDPAGYGIHNKMFLFNIGGRKVVHAGSLNGTEISSKLNREVALQVESSAAYDYVRPMFEYDWAWQPRAYLPIILNNYDAPPGHLLISKVFYLGVTNTVTGSEWVQVYNPTGITLSLSSYKVGDQVLPGPTGFVVDGMWQFPASATIAPNQKINIALTAQGFFGKYGFFPEYVFFGPGLQMQPYITWTHNISFSLVNAGDEVLLLGPLDQLVDGVAWGGGFLPGNVGCVAINPDDYPPPLRKPSIARDPIWKDTDNCANDFIVDLTAQP